MNPAKLELWNHHSNDGPRTNNAIEGWHSSLQYKFSRTHLRLAKFLSELQLLFHDVDVRLAELLRGEPPKPRVLTYVANDAASEQLFANFLNVYRAVPLPPGFPDANAWLDSEIWRYLAHLRACTCVRMCVRVCARTRAHHIGVGN